METYKEHDFVIIDDDFINNATCEAILRKEFPGTKIYTFINPQKGCEHIDSTYSAFPLNKAVLFLDINMPAFDGWEVLEELEKSSSLSAGCQLKIFILSSSVSPRDKRKAENHPFISGYVDKPLTMSKIREILTSTEASEGTITRDVEVNDGTEFNMKFENN